ncbi:MAG: MFS transporter [Acidimicrobiales bacterium]
MSMISHTFRSFRTRNYRLFYLGQLVSLSGTACQVVALSWVVYQLTDSAVSLGTVTGLSLLPMLLAGPWGGLLADRFDKRRLLIAANAFMAAIAVALATVTLLGRVEVWQLYFLAFLSGLGSAVEIPTRQSFVNEIVGPEQLPNAIGLNSAMFNAGRIVGPAIAAGLLALAGNGWCFVANAVSFIAVIEAYRRMRPAELRPAKRSAAGRGQMLAGVRYVWAEPVLRRTILLVGVVAFFSFNFPVILPVLAERTYGGGAGLFSALTATMATGSVVGALLVAGRRRPTDRMLLVAGLTSGLVLLAAASTTSLFLVVPLLGLAGAAGISFFSTANARIQLVAAGEVRGRVMALYTMVFLGSTPVGAPLVGWVVQHFGAQVALGGGGLIAAGAVAVTLLPGALAERRLARAEPNPELDPVEAIPQPA